MKKIKFNIIYLLTVLIIWQLIVVVFKIPEYFIPSPIDIIKSLTINFNLLLQSTLITVLESLISIIISVFLGIGLAILMDKYKLFANFFSPIITMTQTTPMVIVSTVLIVVIGFGYLSKIIIIVVLCTFPILIATYRGLLNIDNDYLDFFKSSKIKGYKVYKYLKIPLIRNEIYSGIHISVTYLIGSAILAEYMGSQGGLGFYLSRAVQNFNTSEVFAIALISILLTMINLKIVAVLKNRRII